MRDTRQKNSIKDGRWKIVDGRWVIEKYRDASMCRLYIFYFTSWNF